MDDEEAQCYIDRFPDIQFTYLEEPSKVAKKEEDAKITAAATVVANATANATADPDRLGDGKKINEEYTKNPIQFAKDHFDYWGFFEQRNRHCAPRLTDI